MPNPLFGKLNGNNSVNGMPFNLPNGFNPNNKIQAIQQLTDFAKTLKGANPQQVVQQLINTGKMSQEQFQQLSQIANNIRSMLK